ncbi:hypothetical protein ACF0H5_005569 [Mactra antiquata]
MSTKSCETNLDEGVLHNSEWVHRWAVGNTAFHRPIPDKFLDANEESMFDGKIKSLFLPLCGKTPDITWMYNKGHTVCGVEIAEQPIKEYFEENKIDYETEQVENVGTLYKSKDGRLKLYVADLFDLSVSLCGQFDIIWDSKSLVAINLADRELYKDLMLSLLKPGGQYYLAVLEYDPKCWPGPPHTVPDDVVKHLYSTSCKIDLVEEAERSGQNINEVKKDNDASSDKEAPKPALSSAGAAIKTSAYVFDRWYKMVLNE